MKGSIVRNVLRYLLFVVVMTSLRFAPAAAQVTPNLRYIGFSPAAAPADKVACRLAIAYAIDRDAIVSAVTAATRGTARAAWTIQHPRLPGYDPSVKAYPYDPAKAKEYLSQCGWQGPLTIKTSAFSNDYLRALGQALETSVRRALDTAVVLEPVPDFQALVQDTRNGRVPIYTFGWTANPQDFGYPSFALGIANERPTDPELKPLLDARNAAAVEKMLLEKALIVPIIYF